MTVLFVAIEVRPEKVFQADAAQVWWHICGFRVDWKPNLTYATWHMHTSVGHMHLEQACYIKAEGPIAPTTLAHGSLER